VDGSAMMSVDSLQCICAPVWRTADAGQW